VIRGASLAALDAGADFIKTSTGKVAVNATPEAARNMLEAIRARGGRAGFKAAGGVRSVADAALYLELADEILGAGWADPAALPHRRECAAHRDPRGHRRHYARSGR
jgi:deoxyribose-phosphate aldolase